MVRKNKPPVSEVESIALKSYGGSTPETAQPKNDLHKPIG